MRILFSLVSEDRPDWHDRVIAVALSIRRFGGSLADAPILANFVESVAPAAERRLAGLDTSVAIVDRFDHRYPYANKLRMLQQAADRSFDVLVALDCDVLVLGDVRDHMVEDAVRAKVADIDVLRRDEWMRLWRALELQAPAPHFLTTTLRQQTVPYFNSGVMFVPQHLCGDLFEGWSRYLYDVLSLHERDPKAFPAARIFTDQVALSCALVGGGLKVDPLPVSLNLPLHVRTHRSFLPDVRPPFIVHVHKNVTVRGFVQSSAYPQVNRLLDRFNLEWAQASGIPYPGLPPRPLARRVKQYVRSHRWYHAGFARNLRETVRGARPRIRGS
jgi:hypothetical protein